MWALHNHMQPSCHIINKLATAPAAINQAVDLLVLGWGKVRNVSGYSTLNGYEIGVTSKL